MQAKRLEDLLPRATFLFQYNSEMPEVQIRPATLEDFGALVPLMKSFATTREAGLRERFRHVLLSADHVLLVAELEGVVVGYAVAQGYGARLRSGEESVRLHDLMVAPASRRNGVGRALFAGIKTYVQKRGSRYLEWQSSMQGTAFYERLGLHGDPNPQPDHPFFEMDFASS
jgi:ribosomal protein S18 acetylase RimI-like enzyme